MSRFVWVQNDWLGRHPKQDAFQRETPRFIWAQNSRMVGLLYLMVKKQWLPEDSPNKTNPHGHMVHIFGKSHMHVCSSDVHVHIAIIKQPVDASSKIL